MIIECYIKWWRMMKVSIIGGGGLVGLCVVFVF